MRFEDRAAEMGLSSLANGNFFYSDRYSTVLLRQLNIKSATVATVELPDDAIPYYGVFVKPKAWPNQPNMYKFCGIVSNDYKFMGNDVLNEVIRGSIKESGQAIFMEEVTFSGNFSKMHAEISIAHPSVIQRVGTIYPQINVRNTYDGTGRQLISFGLCMMEADSIRYTRFGFPTKLGTISQVHLNSASSRLSSQFGNYVEVFSESIEELISRNFTNQITASDMLNTLGLVEEVGKRRRDGISAILKEIVGGEPENMAMTSWQLFLAIVRYSTMEKNLNAKVLLEDIAERVLIIPDRMMNVVDRLSRQQAA
jgi:hypothetical protein